MSDPLRAKAVVEFWKLSMGLAARLLAWREDARECGALDFDKYDSLDLDARGLALIAEQKVLDDLRRQLIEAGVDLSRNPFAVSGPDTLQ
jgi:hypothetical protein